MVLGLLEKPICCRCTKWLQAPLADLRIFEEFFYICCFVGHKRQKAAKRFYVLEFCNFIRLAKNSNGIFQAARRADWDYIQLFHNGAIIEFSFVFSRIVYATQ